MQIFLKRLFDAVLTDKRVHGVALFLIRLVFLGGHLPNRAEQMRGVGGVVFADGGRLHNDARHAQLHHGGKLLRLHVGGERVVFKTDAADAAQLQLVADADDLVRLLLRPVVGDAVRVHEVFHERLRGNIGVIVAVCQKRAVIALPGGGLLIHRERIRALGGHGKVRLIGDALLVAQLQHAKQTFVRRFGVEEHEVDDDEVVARAVRDENVAVAVENIAARCLHRGHVGDGVGVACDIRRIGLRRLHLIKPQREQPDERRRECEKQKNAKADKSLHGMLLSECGEKIRSFGDGKCG